MNEQMMFANVVRQMITSFEKFVEDYEKLPTTATDSSVINNLESINTNLNRLLRKHKIRAAVDENCEDNVEERKNSVPTVKAINGDTIKQRRIEDESNETVKSENERDEVLKKAELSILKSIAGGNSDEEDSKITTSVPSPKNTKKKSTQPPVAVEDDPHITKIADDYYRCDVCKGNMSLANATSHILGKSHLKKAKLMSRESSLNRTITDCDKPLPDLQYEYIEVDIPASVYKCTICNVLVSSCENNVKQHVDGSKHKKELTLKKLSIIA